jgi:hypothetical protein
MRKMMVPKEQSHSRMEIKVWSKDWVKIAVSPDHSISNVFLVDSLDYNLLSVSQLCKMAITVYLLTLMLPSLEEVMIQ